jgi:hypothetical protein
MVVLVVSQVCVPSYSISACAGAPLATCSLTTFTSDPYTFTRLARSMRTHSHHSHANADLCRSSKCSHCLRHSSTCHFRVSAIASDISPCACITSLSSTKLSHPLHSVPLLGQLSNIKSNHNRDAPLSLLLLGSSRSLHGRRAAR